MEGKKERKQAKNKQEKIKESKRDGSVPCLAFLTNLLQHASSPSF
jgi:hypothetical protein